MSKLAAVIKEEVSRLGRKEVKRAAVPLKRRITALERLVREQRAALKQLAQRVTAAGKSVAARGAAAAESAADDGARLTARTIKSLRKRLRLSQAQFAKLAGVSHVSVYLWEAGRTRPRGASRAGLLRLRGLGLKDVRRQLDELGTSKPARRKRRTKKRTARRAPKRSSRAAESRRRA